jgi:4-amino-4-deoxy-L-arabinose transferase-like glycosyltransferase
VLVVFVVAKIPALHYPFYWDESWSYAPAVKLMYLHGPSLMPNAIDLFYSRGHPLLFYASAAAWMRVFGPSHIAQHSFCLFISLALIVAVYETSLRLFGKRAAILAMLLLPLQVMFFVQSTFLLPEIMIALLSLLTLYFYVNGKYALTFLCCIALMLTKESGMVMGLVLGIHATLNLLNNKETRRERVVKFGAILLSGVVIGLFFLLQKNMNGWYFYPEHTGYIQLEWHIFWDKFRFALDVLFCTSFRVRLFQLLMLLAIIVSVHLRDIRYAVPVLPGYLIYVIIEDKFMWLPRQALLVIFLLALALAAYQLVHLSVNRAKQKAQFIYLGMFFLAAYLCFTCINFFTARYLLCVLVIALVLAAAYIDVYICALYDLIYYLTIACIALVGFYGFKYDAGLGDLNLGAFDGMTVQQDLITYFEHAGLYDKKISTGSFQDHEHFLKPFTGFLHTDKVFKNTGNDTAADYFVFDNIEPDGRYGSIKDNPAYRLVYKTARGQAWGEVYEKVK